ncbi:hypothetical protein BKA70DRAFT_1287986, partial [Coprinopsis sp. MPI-PUGE-AT-0042]
LGTCWPVQWALVVWLPNHFASFPHLRARDVPRGAQGHGFCIEGSPKNQDCQILQEIGVSCAISCCKHIIYRHPVLYSILYHSPKATQYLGGSTVQGKRRRRKSSTAGPWSYYQPRRGGGSHDPPTTFRFDRPRTRSSTSTCSDYQH